MHTPSPRTARHAASARKPPSTANGRESSTASAQSSAAAPTFASPLQPRPSTVPAQLRTVVDAESRPSSRPVSRQQQNITPRGPSQGSNALDSPAMRAASLTSSFAFSDPHANAMFHANGDGMPEPPRRKEPMQQHPQQRAATATPAKQQRASMFSPAAPSNPRPTPPFSAAPLSATSFSAHIASPRSVALAQRPAPPAEAQRFDSAPVFGKLDSTGARLAHSPRAPSIEGFVADRTLLPREFEHVRGIDFDVDAPATHNREPRFLDSFEELSSDDDATTDSKTQDDTVAVRRVATSMQTAKPRARIHAETHAPMFGRESWSLAARASIPLQYDGVHATAATKAPRTVAQIHEETARLMHLDSMRLYKLAHASERDGREQRSKPWRENCALGDESHTAPPDPVAPVAQAASANDPVYRSLSDQLTGLISQHTATQSMLKQQRAQARLSALFAARTEERRAEREKEVLLLREDEENDEALREAQLEHQAAMKAGLPPPPSALRTFPSHLIEDEEDFLARSRDPMAKLVVTLQQQVAQSVVWDQLMTQLLDPAPARTSSPAGSALPLLTKPLRLLLGRVHAHHQSVTHPLKDLLQLLTQKMTQQWKFDNLMAAGGDAASGITTGARGHDRNSSSMSSASSVAGSSSLQSHGRSGSDFMTSVSAMSARIHTLQHAHLHRLQDQLGSEYRTSLQLSQDLQTTKENISAKVSMGLFRQQYTRLAQKKAAELAAASSDGSNAPSLRGAGSAGGNAEHASRHHFDYDVRSKTIVAASTALPEGVVKRYLEDDIEHALVDEDPSASGTHYTGAVSDVVDQRVHAAAVLAADDATLHPHLAEVDPQHLKHMPAMHEFIASFKRGKQQQQPSDSAHASSVGEEEDDTLEAAKARATRSAALQTLLTRPVLRIHALTNGDVLHGQVGYHSYYYVFRLSGTENGAFIRVIQHPSDIYEEFGKRPEREEEPPFDPEHPEVDRDLRKHRTDIEAYSPATTEDEANFLDVFLNPLAPPTRLAHTHKATTKGSGMCSLDLRASNSDSFSGTGAGAQADAKATRRDKKHGRDGSEDDARPGSNAKTLNQLLATTSTNSTLYSTSSLWFLRIIGRGMRPKGFTLEFRTNTEVLDYSNVFNQLLSDLEEQSQWQQSLADKMVTVDQLMAAFLPQPKFGTAATDASLKAESTALVPVSSTGTASKHSAPGESHALIAMYPNPLERPSFKEIATQTHVTALHEIDVEASMRRKEEETAAALLAEEVRLAEERKSTMSLGALRALFTYPLVPRKQLRIWSQSTLLKLITTLYREKLKYDADHHEALQQFQVATYRRNTDAANAGISLTEPLTPPRKLSFTEFVLRFFKDRYGLVRLAELYCFEFIHSIEKKYLHLLRTQLFARMVHVLTPFYPAADVEWFFSTPLRLLWVWQGRYNFLPSDNELGQSLVPYHIIEDTLWDSFSPESIRNSARIATLASKSAGAVAGASSEQAEQTQAEFRMQEICLSAWANHLVLRLRSHLIIKESLLSTQQGPINFTHHKPKVHRTYWVDSDAFLTMLMEMGSKSRMLRTVDELKLKWKRMFVAKKMVEEREREERAKTVGGYALNRAAAKAAQLKAESAPDRAAIRAAALNAGSSSDNDGTRFSDRSCLRLPDWLGVMRIEFPHLDELELYLLYVECTKAPSQHRSEDAVFLEGFLRVALRYELGEATVAAPEAIAAPSPPTKSTKSGAAGGSSPRKGAAKPASTAVIAAASSPPLEEKAVDPAEAAPTSAPRLVPVSKLHLTTHRLPYPTLVLPGFKQVDRSKAAAAAAASAKGGAGGSQKKKKSGVPSFGPPIAAPKWLNAGSVVWDDLAEARQIPEVHRSVRDALQALGTGTHHDSIRRPTNLSDHSAFLPPSMLPPLKLKAMQSIRLLSNLQALFQPMLLDNLSRIQSAWTVPGAFDSEELDRYRLKLARVYELLSDLQMHIETRRRKPGAAAASSPIADAFDAEMAAEEERLTKARAALSAPPPLKLKRTPEEIENSLYESEEEESSEEDEPGGRFSHRSGGGGSSGKKRHPSSKWSKSDSDSLVHLCWSTFRSLLTTSSDLFVAHSNLYGHLLELTSPEGKAMVSTEFAGGDVHRAFAQRQQQQQLSPQRQ